MNQNRAPESLGLHELALECANQEALYRKLGRDASDPRFCYELFRRAVVHKNEEAWSLVYQQYKPQVISWIRQNPAFRPTQQAPDDFVNEAFAKFWRAVSPKKFTQRLKTLEAVLLYLKKCAASALYNHQRALKRQNMRRALEQVEADLSNPATKHPVEYHILQASNAEQLWGLVESLLKSEREKVAMENYILEKKAKQIQADYSHLFADVKSVYRTKENLMKRFRRNPNLKAWFTDGGK
ncbi:MAG: hypothetical protein PVF45_05955 [Anaerolineae bacterium]|jgi:DNA-directed RNA polymerase specialized sigma24 family protein